jgi:hypothetical protein
MPILIHGKCDEASVLCFKPHSHWLPAWLPPDFEEYINGEYVFASPSSAVGITLSVLFYICLLLLGAGLPKFIKAPLGKLKATLFGCGRRSKVQHLEPPRQAQQAEAPGETQPVCGQAVAREEIAGLPPADKDSAPAVA